MFKVRRGGSEEIPLVQGKEQQLRFAGAAMKRYPTSKVRETQVRWQVLQEGIRGQTLKPYSQKTSQSNHTRTTALSNSMKLNHAYGATQDTRVMVERMVERSDRMWSTGEGNGKPLQYSCLENPMNSMKRQKDNTPSRSVGAQYATGDQWRNNSRNNEEMEPKQQQHPVVGVTGDGSKV